MPNIDTIENGSDRYQGPMNENGAALVISLMFLAILAMLGTTAAIMTTTDMQIGSNYKASAEAFQDANAGVDFAIAKMEAGLEDESFELPTELWDETDQTPADASYTPLDTIGQSKPSDFNFEYEDPGVKMICDNGDCGTNMPNIQQSKDRFSFTVLGANSQSDNSSATIAAIFERTSPINMGLFGDEMVHVHNSANVYSYSHSSNPNPTSDDSTGEAGVGSNKSVILKKRSFVDGNVALGEDKKGNDATLSEYSGAVYSEAEDVDRVDPDPLGIDGGAYGTKLTTASGTNLNRCGQDYEDYPNICGGQRYVFGDDADEETILDEDMYIKNDDLTLKGKPGGANYYFTDMVLKSGKTLYIDTTDGPVNIYLTGGLEAKNNSNIINTANDSDCPTENDDPCCSCLGSCSPGAPSDFSLFANSKTDSIVIKNSAEFHGLIYAPYMDIELKNSASVYGAIMGKTVEMKNRFDFYFDVDLMDNGPEGNELRVLAWENVLD